MHEALATMIVPEIEAVGFKELRAGNLGVRLACSAADLDAAQRLRYRVFYHEMGATPDATTLASGRDCDHFDAIADHLMVIDHDLVTGGDEAIGVVGTYRLIRQEAAARVGQFYSADEYDLSALERYAGRKLELGRSCVDARYRSRAVMQLLWRGIAAYVSLHQIAVMFGCASLPGTDLDALAAPLTYLYDNHLAPPEIRPRALPSRYVEMQRLDKSEVNNRRVLRELPPLIKGYLRLGGFVGDGAVIDRQFNTTDIAVMVQTERITAKYSKHYYRELQDGQ